RHFVRTAALAAATAGVAACARQSPDGATASASSNQTFRWKMVTTWPPNFPGLGTGANRLAEMLDKASGGRLKVKVYGGGELVPALEVFDAVSGGTAEMGHGAAYYWKGKAAAASIFTAIPFGLSATEMNAWLYSGGGLDLWREVYAPFGVLPFPCGNTGVQMGGWFNREINSVADLQGLRMRIPGLGGEVLQRAGGAPVTLPGSEIFTALQTGSIDATEWIGPYNDLAFGLYKAAKYYYYPGWHEPGSTLECIVSRKAFDSLPADLQEILRVCCAAVNDTMLAEFNARSYEALAALVKEHKVDLRPFPDEVLRFLRDLSRQIVEETVAGDPQFAKVYASASKFQAGIANWTRISDQAYYAARTL
ncbi:MAG TPA: TRAP transporter substrate-binding protein, partial [Steroidobacteraceae bacterium]|nr:TRAP transporter substrate-binding protein [Steroidobacteraceae bacterium]